MDKQIAVHSFHGILLSNKREQAHGACNNMDASQIFMLGASLVAQWLRICLPMQGTQVRALVWEDLTCRGTTKPMRHNY